MSIFARIAIMLEQKTIELLRQVFENKFCAICGAPAKRIIQKRFLCHKCAQPLDTPPSEYTPKEYSFPNYPRRFS